MRVRPHLFAIVLLLTAAFIPSGCGGIDVACGPTRCDIDGECQTKGTESPGNSCLVCDPDRNATGWSALECAGGPTCTTGQCVPGSGCVYEAIPDCECTSAADCTDAGPCQMAVCSDGVCGFAEDPDQSGQACGDACTSGAVCTAGECTGGAEKDCSGVPTGTCQVAVCNPDTGACEADAAPNATLCDDGDPCTVGDACTNGLCAGTDKDCAAPCIINAYCAPDGTCGGAWDTTDPECACTDDSDCDDSLPCTTDTCDSASGACVFTPVDGTCAIDFGCWFQGEVNPDNACQRCDPAAPGSWSVATCDDGNDCTTDSCDPLSGCQTAPVSNGVPCDDGDPCTTNETCQDGACAGTCECTLDSDCEDSTLSGGVCERVACINFACVVVPDAALEGAACDDADLCTTGETCTSGSCIGGTSVVCSAATACATSACDPATGACVDGPVDVGAACDDGDPCTDDDACGGSGDCAGTPRDCSAFEDGCNSAACVAGTCVQQATPGAGCDDGQVCTTGDTCNDSGVCAGDWDTTVSGCICTSDLECDDGLACTVDSCSPTGACIASVKAGFCAIGGTCLEAGSPSPTNACQVCSPLISKSSWQPLDCDDGNACTDDVCAAAAGCISTADNSNPCSDGDPCSSDDACVDGACVGTCECTVDADCTDTPDPCRRFVCQAFQCVQVADGTQEGQACDDGAWCTTGDACAAGVCTPSGVRDCSDTGDGACVEGICDEFGDQCVAQAVADGNACSDGDACTIDDACDGGVCAGSPLDCSGEVDACNDAACVDGVCQKAPTPGAACQVGNDPEDCWTADACSEAGVCEGTWDAAKAGCGCAADSDCANLNDACNTGRCDVATGSCYADPEPGQPCDDGNPCSSNDTCNPSGQCVGAAYSCNDLLACTVDTCDGAGGCSHEVQAAKCLIGGSCFNQGQLNPDSVCQMCDQGTSWSANDGVACDDGEACTHSDVCDAQQCVGTAYTCDALAGCQTAQCNGTGGCDVSTQASFCAIDGSCIPAGTADPSDPCRSCIPAQNQADWSFNTAPCDDGQPCTRDDICSAGTCAGTSYVCNDGKACTSDTCTGDGGCAFAVLPGFCLAGGECFDDGDKPAGVQCRVCDASSPNTLSNVAAGVACDDGLSCTSDDACNGQGACGGASGCQALECETATCSGSGCDIALKPGWCKIDGACVLDGSRASADPADPGVCQVCDAASAPNAWSPATGSCDDGNPCSSDDVCGAGACAGTAYSCDDGIGCTVDTCDGDGSCSHTLAADACLIGGACYAQGDTAADTCQRCQPTVNANGWSPAADGEACADDGLGCTDNACLGGTCAAFVADGFCWLGGVCFDDGAEDPGSSCQVCNAASNSWAFKPSGSPCADDGNSCTVDQCDGASQCVHVAKPNFATCDDGNGNTDFDWCFTAECKGFERLLQSVHEDNAEVEAFDAATDVSSGGVSARLSAPEEGCQGKGCPPFTHTFIFDGTSVDPTDATAEQGGSLGQPMSPIAVPLGGQMWEWASGQWELAGLSDAWDAAGEALAATAMGWTAESPATFWGAGRAPGDPLPRVRRCDGGVGWSCYDQPVHQGDFEPGAWPVAYGRISGTWLMMAHWRGNPEDPPTYLDVLQWGQSPSGFAYYQQRGTPLQPGQQVLGYSIVGGTWLIAVGSGGLLVADNGTDLSSFAPAAVTVPAEWRFTDVVAFEGQVLVIGARLWDDAGTQRKDIYFLQADATANLAVSANWTGRLMATVDTASGGTQLDGHHQVNAAAVATGPDDPTLYLFGGWWNPVSSGMDTAIWRWSAQ